MWKSWFSKAIMGVRGLYLWGNQMITMAYRLWHEGGVNGKEHTLTNEMKIIAIYYNCETKKGQGWRRWGYQIDGHEMAMKIQERTQRNNCWSRMTAWVLQEKVLEDRWNEWN